LIFSVRDDPQKPDRDVKGGHSGALGEWRVHSPALDILIKAFGNAFAKNHGKEPNQRGRLEK
jgi:hypothetical protein